MSVFLVGGGADTTPPGALAGFLAEVRAAAAQVPARIALVLLDQGWRSRRFLPDYRHALEDGGAVVVTPVFLRPGEEVGAGAFGGAHGVVVGGGPTPDYRDGLVGAAAHLQGLVRSGVPYLGFSAGAMITPAAALVGGHRLGDREVCPVESSEGLEQLTVRPGLGLVSFAVDVHTAQAGTLSGTVALVDSGAADTAVGIDEGTCLAVRAGAADPGDGEVSGSGAVWFVRRAGGAVQVTRRTAPSAR